MSFHSLIFSANKLSKIKNHNSSSKYFVDGLTGSNGSFAIATSKKELNALQTTSADVVYHSKKGKLYLNKNGTDKGWGEKNAGGLIAKFKGKPTIGVENFSNLSAYEDASKEETYAPIKVDKRMVDFSGEAPWAPLDYDEYYGYLATNTLNLKAGNYLRIEFEASDETWGMGECYPKVEIISPSGKSLHTTKVVEELSGESPLIKIPSSGQHTLKLLTDCDTYSLKASIYTNTSDVIDETINLTNAERIAEGLNPLKASKKLDAPALAHTKDIITNNIQSHTGSDGSTVEQRVKRTTDKYTIVGENILGGAKSPEQAIQQWMDSSGHRANILDADYEEIGIGFLQSDSYPYSMAWTQVFGTQA